MALEFFSGIGGWSCALERLEQETKKKVKVVAAFDNNVHANQVYHHRFGLAPSTRDIALLKASELNKYGASVWLMSPPCQPFTQGGKRQDDRDPRSGALLNLISLIEQGQEAIPSLQMIALENVPLFAESRARERLLHALHQNHFVTSEYTVSPEHYGIPNRRMRYYMIATRRLHHAQIILQPPAPNVPIKSLEEFFGPRLCSMQGPPVPESWYADASGFRFHVVSLKKSSAAASVVTSCFTKAYFDHKNGGGSYVRNDDGEEEEEVAPEELATDVSKMHLCFFSPQQALALMSFPEDFEFPEGMPIKTQYRLIGNSVNVYVCANVLKCLFY